MKKIIASIVTILVLITVSCTNDDDFQPPADLEIHDFVWKGMNTWYNWQELVPDLANSKDDDQSQYLDFLNGYSEPSDLYYSLCYEHWTAVGDANATDRFSWFVEDYEVQNQQFQGISKAFGFTRSSPLQINSEGDIVFYLKYVVPNSPANSAELKRGDIIYAIDGEAMNIANYSSLLAKLSNETVTLSLATEDGGILTASSEKTITKATIADNPVYLTKVFDDIGGKKVGYLVYNGFRTSYNDELNAAFATLKSEGINELILDLRLNGGGSVQTSAYLASMIYANANTDQFAELKFNSKRNVENSSYNFTNTLSVFDTDGKTEIRTETINRLSSLDKLYVLVSGGTASASEMIINGLNPFGALDLTLVGTTTYGKNVGSITLYDSGSSKLYTDLDAANPNHKNAMQPIVFQIFNKNGESDYTQGFDPNISVDENQFWYDILPFGDENEVVLKHALDDIRGIATKSIQPLKFVETKTLDDSKFEKRFEKEMYINAKFINK